MKQSGFWTAFWIGLASPLTLYEPLPSYSGGISSYGIGLSFVRVGQLLSQAVGKYRSV